MVARVDSVIAFVREHHRQYVEEGIGKRDILIFSHGTFRSHLSGPTFLPFLISSII